ncbi:MAG: O-antigen ligase family protein [Opitutae bacterium]
MNLSIIKKNFIFYLLFFLPFTIIIGVAITELVVLIIIVFFFFKNKNIKLFKNSFFIFLILISFYFAINSAVQIQHNDLKISSIFHWRFALFSLSIFYFLNEFKINKKIQNENILKYFILILFFIFFDSFFQFFYGENILGYKIISNRISSVFKDELILGSFLIKILPLFLWLYLLLNNKLKEKYFTTLFLSLYFIVIYLSAGRTAFALLIFFIFLILITIPNLRKIFIFSFLIMIMFLAFSFFFKIGKSDPSFRLFTKSFKQITNNAYTNVKNNKKPVQKNFQIFSKAHTGHYILSWDLFKKNKVFGIGPKGFRDYCRSVNYNPAKGICSTHPHNTLVQIFLETGILGGLVYIFVLIFILYNCILCLMNKKLDNLKKNSFMLASIAIIINFFPFLPSGNFFNNWISIINYYYIGFYIYNYNILKI